MIRDYLATGANERGVKVENNINEEEYINNRVKDNHADRTRGCRHLADQGNHPELDNSIVNGFPRI